MSFLQPWILWALPLIALPIAIHLINQWRYQTRQWAPMMFLLKATRSNRGLAKLRQWLILALRTAAILGLIFAVSRPLTSGYWSNFVGGKADTMIVLMDRSPSGGQHVAGREQSKLDVGKEQLKTAFSGLAASHWVAVDANTSDATEYPSYQAMLDSISFTPSSASSRIPNMLQAALDYIQGNKPGTADIWLCSDLRSNDWNPESGRWASVRAGFQTLPQGVRIHLLSHAEPPTDNLAIRVTNSYCKLASEATRRSHELIVSLQVTSTDTAPAEAGRVVPIQLELEGVRSQLDVELRSGFAELRDHRIALPEGVESGWGRVSLPADSNNQDNEFYFAFDQAPAQRVLLVADRTDDIRPLEVAAGISPDRDVPCQVETLTSNRISSSTLENVSVVVWQSELPDAAEARVLDAFVSQGGQIIFFPPSPVQGNISNSQRRYRGVRWADWRASRGTPITVTSWRGDSDLLSATNSGAGLPVSQLKIRNYSRIESEQPLTSLATLDGGDPLLTRLPTSSGGVYFFASLPDAKHSTLAEDGVVLFVMLQRAIQSGRAAIHGARMRDAGAIESPEDVHGTGLEEEQQQDDWLRIAGSDAISSEYEFQAGIYRSGDRLFAVNRPESEDRVEFLPDEKLQELFDGIPFHRISQRDAGASIIREIWRLILVGVLVALLLESILSLPRTHVPSQSRSSLIVDQSKNVDLEWKRKTPRQSKQLTTSK